MMMIGTGDGDRRRGGRRILLLTIALFSVTGCSVQWPFNRPIPIGPGRSGLGIDSTSVVVTPASDTTAMVRQAPKRPRKIRALPPETVPDSLTTVLSLDSLLAEPDTTDAEKAAVSISVDRPPETERRLRQEVVDKLDQATALTVAAARAALTAEDREKIETVRGLIEQAQAALDRGDIQAAANLSHKARLLAANLSTR